MTIPQIIAQLRNMAKSYNDAADSLATLEKSKQLPVTSKRNLSAAARKRISVAQKKRWGTYKSREINMTVQKNVTDNAKKKAVRKVTPIKAA